jgi:hypothetical protein
VLAVGHPRVSGMGIAGTARVLNFPSKRGLMLTSDSGTSSASRTTSCSSSCGRMRMNLAAPCFSSPCLTPESHEFSERRESYARVGVYEPAYNETPFSRQYFKSGDMPCWCERTPTLTHRQFLTECAREAEIWSLPPLLSRGDF